MILPRLKSIWNHCFRNTIIQVSEHVGISKRKLRSIGCRIPICMILLSEIISRRHTELGVVINILRQLGSHSGWVPLETTGVPVCRCLSHGSRVNTNMLWRIVVCRVLRTCCKTGCLILMKMNSL